LSHFEQTSDIINYSAILETMSGTHMRVARKRKSRKKEFDDEEKDEIKPKKQKKVKKAPKIIVSKSSLPSIQEEVDDLGPVEVLDKRTRGGSSKVVSESKTKVQKKGKRNVRKIIQSKYTVKEDA